MENLRKNGKLDKWSNIKNWNFKKTNINGKLYLCPNVMGQNRILNLAFKFNTCFLTYPKSMLLFVIFCLILHVDPFQVEETDEARTKFTNAKSISSAQFFGDQNRSHELEAQASLQRFSVCVLPFLCCQLWIGYMINGKYLERSAL